MADANSALLRAAERALQQQNYPEVVKCCKQVLKQDRRSYGAYVLLAKALQGTHHFPQALVALRKALELDDSALPAWLVRQTCCVALRCVVGIAFCRRV